MSDFDFTVHDRVGRVTVQAVIQAHLGTTREWAAGYWSNLEAVSLRPTGAFFLLLTPDTLYVWVPSRVKGRGMPTWVLDAANLLAPYYERVGAGPRDIRPMAFALMVSWWLEELTLADGAAVRPLLARTGLQDAMAHGVVVRAMEA
jgi:hypothetical protein